VAGSGPDAPTDVMDPTVLMTAEDAIDAVDLADPEVAMTPVAAAAAGSFAEPDGCIPGNERRMGS